MTKKEMKQLIKELKQDNIMLLEEMNEMEKELRGLRNKETFRELREIAKREEENRKKDPYDYSHLY